jgi:hypothetical protein
MKKVILFILIVSTSVVNAQTFTDADTVITHVEGSFEHKLRINKFPCDYDSTRTCVTFDTLSIRRIRPETVFEWADSIALSIGVPPKLVHEIGMNESRWLNPEDLDYLIRHGDLQVMDQTFQKMYTKLGLTGGKTRYNYLVVAIHYLNNCYKIGGTWQKARYIYGRGRWKEPSQWTSLERSFMNKIDWTQYD